MTTNTDPLKLAIEKTRSLTLDYAIATFNVMDGKMVNTAWVVQRLEELKTLPLDYSVITASAAAKDQTQELTWLYTHCRAIGMTCKSDSGKWEHDMALFTALQKARIEQLERELHEAQQAKVEPKRKFELTPEMREALAKAAENRAQIAEMPNGGVMFINYGDQPEDTSDLDCPHCGGSGHKGDGKTELFTDPAQGQVEAQHSPKDPPNGLNDRSGAASGNLNNSPTLQALADEAQELDMGYGPNACQTCGRSGVEQQAQPVAPIIRKFHDLPLGTRFCYIGGKDEWVIIERHGCGLVARYQPHDGWAAGQSICSFADTEEECRSMKVEVRATTTRPDNAGKEAQGKGAGS